MIGHTSKIFESIKKKHYVSILIHKFVSLQVACVKSYHMRPKVLCLYKKKKNQNRNQIGHYLETILETKSDITLRLYWKLNRTLPGDYTGQYLETILDITLRLYWKPYRTLP